MAIQKKGDPWFEDCVQIEAGNISRKIFLPFVVDFFYIFIFMGVNTGYYFDFGGMFGMFLYSKSKQEGCRMLEYLRSEMSSCHCQIGKFGGIHVHYLFEIFYP